MKLSEIWFWFWFWYYVIAFLAAGFIIFVAWLAKILYGVH